jgi:DNA-binding transcriptional regulator YiaG
MMPKKSLPRIAAVAVGGKPMTLVVQWLNGDRTAVDVTGLVETFRVFAPLRDSRALFRKARVGEYGADIVWPGDIDMSADTLWRLAQEQNGATLSAEDFRNWRERRELTLDNAARALGISRRMVAYYEEGKKPIPRVVALATQALELTSAAP